VGGELRLIVPNLRHVGYRMVVDQMLPTDYWVLYGEQEYAKNFHAAGFTPRSLALLVESLGCFKDIETSEGDVFGDLNNINWSFQLRAKKISHPVIDNIVPENIPPAPASPAWWPMAIYPTYNERPMTEEEIKNDVRYNVAAKQSPKKFDFIGKPEERMWGPIPQDWVEPVEKVEEKDSGMDSEATIDEQKPEKKRRVSSRKTPRST
jgi:hypothetical protein